MSRALFEFGGVEALQLQPPLHRSARMCARWRIVWGALSFCKTNCEINGFAFGIPRRSWTHAQFGSAFNNRIGNLERTTHPTNKTAREFRAVRGFDVRTSLICNHDPGFPQVLDDTLTKARPLRLAGWECDDAGRTLLDRCHCGTGALDILRRELKRQRELVVYLVTLVVHSRLAPQ